MTMANLWNALKRAWRWWHQPLNEDDDAAPWGSARGSVRDEEE